MQIESIIRRKGGTKVEIGGVTYTFSSTANDPRQICDVADNAAIQKLLAIKEGYRIADPARAEPVSDDVKAEKVVSAALSSAAAQLKPAATQLKPAGSTAPASTQTPLPSPRPTAKPIPSVKK